jgi:trk system potassium uptake protein
MNTGSRSVMASIAPQLHQVERRLVRTGLLSRTGLCSALVLVTALDLVQLRVASLHVTLTSLQTALFALVMGIAIRRDVLLGQATPLLKSARTKAYLFGASGFALFALSQKWWIALQEVAERIAYAGTYRVMSVTVTLAGVLLILGGAHRLARYFAAFAEHPARQTALSFLGLAALGSFLLTVPICVRDPRHVSFLNALFMATSAVCVTGLAVYDIGAEYTVWGQGVLLALVQVGGLGIMVLSASLVVLAGRKLRARSSAVLAEVLDTESVASLRGNIRRIVLLTLSIESVGALLLYFAMARHAAFSEGSPFANEPSGRLVFAAVFSAVSAFCNAGFALTADNLVPFVSSYEVCTIVMVLITLGGLGFPVLSELSHRGLSRLRRRRIERLTLHTRVVLLGSVVLVVGIAAILLVLEWNQALSHLAWHDRAFAALFQSVTLRTAGFNTVSFATFTNAGLLIAMLMMFIGASPGGTGGGMKVTTFVVLFATLRAELRGADEPVLFDRLLPAATVRRAIAVAFTSVVVLTSSVILLLLSESHDPLRLAFEAMSAFGTVGLSVDLTPKLSAIGKLIIILTMLTGRVGPLTVALAASDRNQRIHHRRPHERVLIG